MKYPPRHDPKLWEKVTDEKKKRSVYYWSCALRRKIILYDRDYYHYKNNSRDVYKYIGGGAVPRNWPRPLYNLKCTNAWEKVIDEWHFELSRKMLPDEWHYELIRKLLPDDQDYYQVRSNIYMYTGELSASYDVYKYIGDEDTSDEVLGPGAEVIGDKVVGRNWCRITFNICLFNTSIMRGSSDDWEKVTDEKTIKMVLKWHFELSRIGRSHHGGSYKIRNDVYKVIGEIQPPFPSWPSEDLGRLGGKWKKLNFLNPKTYELQLIFRDEHKNPINQGDDIYLRNYGDVYKYTGGDTLYNCPDPSHDLKDSDVWEKELGWSSSIDAKEVRRLSFALNRKLLLYNREFYQVKNDVYKYTGGDAPPSTTDLKCLDGWEKITDESLTRALTCLTSAESNKKISCSGIYYYRVDVNGVYKHRW